MKGIERVVGTGRLQGTRRRSQARGAGPAVGCLFCREPIAISSFVAGRQDPRVLSAACGNCGLLVSATSTALATWSRPNDMTERELAARMRARRVALGTRAILERVGASEALEGQPV